MLGPQNSATGRPCAIGPASDSEAGTTKRETSPLNSVRRRCSKSVKQKVGKEASRLPWGAARGMPTGLTSAAGGDA